VNALAADGGRDGSVTGAAEWAPPPADGLGRALLVSVLLHGAAVVLVLGWRAGRAVDLPSTYQVNLIAAPAGDRAAGVVRDAPSPAEAVPAPAKAESNAAEKVAPIEAPTRRRESTRATTNVTPQPARAVDASRAPTAGGGTVGGTGTDVAMVRTEGIDFPYPGYLQNIVRQIALDFRPRNPGALRAEVFFLIRRDGSVTGFRFVQRSGNYAFDLEAEAAIEAAAARFGPLPGAFGDDILPVSFSFDPSRLR
jgi:protein TonB